MILFICIRSGIFLSYVIVIQREPGIIHVPDCVLCVTDTSDSGAGDGYDVGGPVTMVRGHQDADMMLAGDTGMI